MRSSSTRLQGNNILEDEKLLYSRRLQSVLQTHLENGLKTSWRYVLKTSWKQLIKSFEYPNNKSANDQSVSHNISEMKNIRLKNFNNIIFPQININSLRNKFELLSHYVSSNIGILITMETKVGSFCYICTQNH